ncbi:hypothetical protein ACJ41P_26445 [Azospirillum argentinense]|uniref:MarR family transcriptional regulator n=1 Tax=Azospirillum argentinense TaxID=2970906 RepID=A0ABW8VE11_9PROT
MAPLTFAERLAEHLRLVILRSLTEVPPDEQRRFVVLWTLTAAPGYASNLSLLQDELEGWYLHVTRDQMRTLADWLVEQGLAVHAGQDPAPGIRLTQRGLDAGRSVVTVSGVAAKATTTWLHSRVQAMCLDVSLADVEEAVDWLAAHSLVVHANDFVMPTTKTADVAAGRARVAGVKAPSPSSIMAAAANSARGLLGG